MPTVRNPNPKPPIIHNVADRTVQYVSHSEIHPTHTKLELPSFHIHRCICGIPVNDTLTILLVKNCYTRTGNMLRFYHDGKYHHDFMLPFNAHTILLSPDGLTLTAMGYTQITQIDLD